MKSIQVFFLAAATTAAAFAQQPLRIPIAGTFGPVAVASGQSMRICVAHVFANSLTRAELPKNLAVRVIFIDARNGQRLVEPVTELNLNLLEGKCVPYEPASGAGETLVLGAVVPISDMDGRTPSAELLPIASAMVMNGTGSDARTAHMVPLVPKVNLLVLGR
jgi:hypothetical protein